MLFLAPMVSDLSSLILRSKWIDKSWVFFTCLVRLLLSLSPYVPQVVNYSDSRTAEEICESSSKMITFIDLAGHHKYLKTTIFGLTSYCPDFAMLVVSANTGIGECCLTCMD